MKNEKQNKVDTIFSRKYRKDSDSTSVKRLLADNIRYTGTKFYHCLPLFEFQTTLSGFLGDSYEEDGMRVYFDEDTLVGFMQEELFVLKNGYEEIFSLMVSECEKDSDEGAEFEIYAGDSVFERILSGRDYVLSGEYWTRRDRTLGEVQQTVRMPEGFILRQVDSDTDRDELTKLYQLCYGICFPKDTFAAFTKDSTYRKELDLVAVDKEGHLCALCSSRYDEQNRMVTVEAVSCDKQYRRKGLSRALLLHTFKTAKDMGAEIITVYTADSENNPAPNALYEAVGFKLVGNLRVWRK